MRRSVSILAERAQKGSQNVEKTVKLGTHYTVGHAILAL
jgi:hypothetical protein